jgi:hypothetical protein
MMVVVIVMIMIVLMMLTTLMLVVALVPLLLANHVLLVAQLSVSRLLALMLPGSNVTRVVLNGLHEINPSVASVVLVAVKSPRPRMLGWNMQIERLPYNHVLRGLFDDHRLSINQRRWRPAANVHSTIYTGGDLTADSHIEIYIGIHSGGSESQSRHRSHAIGILHNQSFSPKARIQPCATRRKVAERFAALE